MLFYNNYKMFIKTIINICVIFVLYKIFTSYPNDVNRNNDMHNHCVKTTRKETKFYKGSLSEFLYETPNKSKNHDHDFLEKYYIGRHSHDKKNSKIPHIFNYNPQNVYEAGYDIQLEYFFKCFFSFIIIFCTLVANKAF